MSDVSSISIHHGSCLNPNVSQLLTVNTPCFMFKPYDTSIFHSSTRFFRPPAAQGRAWNISSCCVRFCRSSFTRLAAAAAVLRAAEGWWGDLSISPFTSKNGDLAAKILGFHTKNWDLKQTLGFHHWKCWFFEYWVNGSLAICLSYMGRREKTNVYIIYNIYMCVCAWYIWYIFDIYIFIYLFNICVYIYVYIYVVVKISCILINSRGIYVYFIYILYCIQWYSTPTKRHLIHLPNSNNYMVLIIKHP